jgi:hypothetical protein
MQAVIRSTSGMNRPQTNLASSAQSIRCWRVPSDGCDRCAHPLSEAIAIPSNARPAMMKILGVLLAAILDSPFL